jgi:hypothetical protein
MNNHLAICKNVTKGIREMAQLAKADVSSRKAYNDNANAGRAVTVVPFAPGMPMAGSSQIMPPSSGKVHLVYRLLLISDMYIVAITGDIPYYPIHPPADPHVAGWAQSSTMTSPIDPTRPPTRPGSLVEASSSLSLEPSESASYLAIGGGINAGENPSFEETDRTKFRRTASRSASNSRGASPSGSGLLRQPIPWSAEKNEKFVDDLLTVLVSCDLPFNLVESPVFKRFIQEYIPYARLPSRNTFSGTVLTRRLISIRTASRTEAADQRATVQCDGWTGRNNQHLVAFMITTEDGQVCVQLVP